MGNIANLGGAEQVKKIPKPLRALCLCGEERFGDLTAEAQKTRRR